MIHFNINNIKMLKGSIIFTEKEYELWFQQGRDNIAIEDLRKELANRGIHADKIMHEEIENFVFNSIIWKTPDFLFPIYKQLVEKLSFKMVTHYVNSRRYYNERTILYYGAAIAGIILADTNQQYQGLSMYYYIKKGKKILSNYVCTSCTCPFENFPTCSVCFYYMILFANDCIIHLGRPLYIELTYNFLLFYFGVKDRIIKDIFSYMIPFTY